MQLPTGFVRHSGIRLCSRQPGGFSLLRDLKSGLLPRQLLKAGAAGVICGLAVKCHREQHEDMRKIVSYCLTAGVTVMAVGAVYSVVAGRGKTSSMFSYILSTGVTAAGVTGVFLCSRAVLSHQTTVLGLMKRWEFSSYFSSSHQLTLMASAFTGFFLSTFTFRRPRDILVTSLLGGCLGFVGELSYHAFRRWKQRKAYELYYKDHVDSLAKDNDSGVTDRGEGERHIWGQWIVEKAQGKSYAGRLNEKIRRLEEAIASEQDIIDTLESIIDTLESIIDQPTTMHDH